ncbi:MAG: alginate export family protein [Bdellovibrionaceae bacterium]|nr:alginate export family protein [Pseudobdellovibrionaceae bacterium]
MRFEDQARTSSFTTSRSYLSMRLRPNITWDLESGAKIVIEPQLAKRFGQEVYSPGQDATGNPTVALTESSGNSAYPGDAITAFQAYIDVPLGDVVRAKIGRMRLRYGDQFILGPGDWGTYGRSFDTVMFSGKLGSLNLDLFQAKVADLGNGADGGDRDLNGAYLNYAGGQALSSFHIYAFERVDLDTKVTATTDTGGPSRLQIYGLRLEGKPGGYAYALEFAKGSGSTAFVGDGSNAEMWVLDLSTPEMAGHIVGLEATSAGENWSELYPSTNKPLGRADVLGRRNLSSQALYVKSSWSEKWGTEFWAYNFQRRATDRRSYGTNGTSAFGSATSTAKEIGNEIDLVVSYKQDKANTWSAAAAAFLPGAYLKDTLDQAGRDVRNSTFAYVMLESKF